MLSDLHDPSAIPALKLLGHRHDIVVIPLRDPAEDSILGAGFIRGREVETGREATLSAKKQFTSLQALTTALKKASLDHFPVRTDQPFLASLRLFLQSRNLLSR